MIQKIIDILSETVDRKFMITGTIIAACGVYLGILFFGENSIPTYFVLKNQKEELSNKIIELTNSNAVLNKQYFELKQQSRKDKEK